MSRYTDREHDKIEYYKYRIRELRYLEREFAIVKEDLPPFEPFAEHSQKATKTSNLPTF